MGALLVFSCTMNCHGLIYNDSFPFSIFTDKCFLTLSFQDVKMTKVVTDRMQNLSLIVSIFFGVWLITISFFLYRFFALYKKLSKGVEVGDLKKLLEKILADGKANKENIKAITKQIETIEEKDKLHIQKIGFIRFNPFAELGGDHSFSLAILDSNDSGVIITSLHTRDRTRVYMKDIKKGKSGFELSVEEKKALANAKKIK